MGQVSVRTDGRVTDGGGVGLSFRHGWLSRKVSVGVVVICCHLLSEVLHGSKCEPFF